MPYVKTFKKIPWSGDTFLQHNNKWASAMIDVIWALGSFSYKEYLNNGSYLVKLSELTSHNQITKALPILVYYHSGL